MSRGVGELSAIQGVLPEWSAPLWGLLTQFGDLWFVAVLFGALYWRQADDREQILALAVTVAIGVSLFVGLKYLFTLPRPDQPLLVAERVPAAFRPIYRLTATASGHGFPSGHATVSTIVYFGLASILPLWDRRRRYVAAGGLVALISFTRIALGLHYLVDVAAGVALGASVLLATRGVREGIAIPRV